VTQSWRQVTQKKWLETGDKKSFRISRLSGRLVFSVVIPKDRQIVNSERISDSVARQAARVPDAKLFSGACVTRHRLLLEIKCYA